MTSFAVLGCGYVGSRVAANLKSTGHYLTGTTRSRSRLHEIGQIVHRPLALDITDRSSDYSFMETQTGLLVSVAPTQNGGDYHSVFADGIQNLSRALLDRTSTDHLHITYISSAGVYGDHQGAVVTESSAVDVSNPINAMLVRAEQTLLSINRNDTSVCVLRLGGIYGPGRDMVSMIKQAAGEQIPKNGNDVPAWSGIEDIVNGVNFAYKRKLIGVYNLVDDMQISRRELSNQICDIDGLPPVIWANENRGNTRSMNAKVSNIKLKSLGFRLSSPSMLMPTTV